MKLKNLTKKLTTLAITALMATTLVSTQNVSVSYTHLTLPTNSRV